MNAECQAFVEAEELNVNHETLRQCVAEPRLRQ
jgi:hypothetical protein